MKKVTIKSFVNKQKKYKEYLKKIEKEAEENLKQLALEFSPFKVGDILKPKTKKELEKDGVLKDEVVKMLCEKGHLERMFDKI